MPEKFIFEFDERGLDRVLEKVREFRQTIREVGQAGELGDGFQRFFNQFIAGTRNSTKTLSDLRSQIQAIQTELQSARFTTELEALQQAVAQRQITPEAARLTPGLGEGTFDQRLGQVQAEVAERQAEAAALRGQGEARVNELLAEQARLEQIVFAEKQRLVQEQQRQANLSQYQNRLETTRANLSRQIRDVRPGGDRLSTLLEERVNNLLQRRIELREQLAQAVAQSRRAAPQEITALLESEIKLTRQITQAKEQQARAEQQVAQARSALRAAGFGAEGEFARRGTGAASEAETNARLEKQTQLRNNLAAAREREERAAFSLNVLEEQRADNAQQLAQVESGGTGLSRGASEVLNRLREVNEQLTILDSSSDALADVLGDPEIVQRLLEVQNVLDSFEGRDLELLSDDEAAQLDQAIVSARNLLNQVEQFPEDGIPLRLSEEELLASLGPVQRILLGAARDFGRRFTATLQFAISGALLFGTQRLVRGFFDAAVEVERTFADISTALQFDIDAERGTAEFERQLEGVRRQVLQIADDFNALPTEVNQAAFQMVSRFQSVEAAMIATRAQILATRVATIDQSEALRALTAVAEATSLSLADMSREEREIATAAQQLRAVDFATAIQQQFQVPIEDTLEGAAGLAAVLTNLGFTIEEVFAIVSTTVLETGQTGQTVTDSLGRAFSQFNTQQVRDEILALANSTEQLTLAPADFFESGRNAFFKIVEQYADLDQQLQARLDEILGQRRETRFIAGLLGGAGEGRLDEILALVPEAAGAAEARLTTLLDTVQGTIEGISTEFQTLAQNLSELGIITPIKAALVSLEVVLKTFNLIVEKALDFVEVLNNIRIPGTDWGLGNALTTMLAMITALASIQSLMSTIKFVANARGATTLIDVFRSFIGLDAAGAGSAAGRLAGSAGAALGFAGFGARVKEANTLMGKFATGIGTLFMAPIRGVIALLKTLQTRLYLWNASILATNGSTLGAIALEGRLFLARAATAAQLGVIAAKGLLTNLTLAGVGSALGTVGAAVARVPSYALAAAGAIYGLQGAFGVITKFVRGLFDDPTEGSRTIATRTQEILAQAEAAGDPISEAAARMQALTERIKELNDELERSQTSGGDTAETFFAQIFGILPGSVADLFPGSEFARLREAARLTIEAAFAELRELQALLENAEEELPEGDPRLDELRNRIGVLFDTLAEFEFTTPDDSLTAYENLLADAQALRDDIPAVDEFFGELADQVREWGEVLTPEEITEALNVIRTGIELGDISLSEARNRIAELRQEALDGLEQAIKGGGSQEDIEAYKRSLEEVRQADKRVFEQERDAALERAQLFNENRTRLLAELEILRDFAEVAANNPNLGPEAVIQAQQEVLEKERELNDAILDEAVARAQFQVEAANTFEDRVEAYRQLIRAIQIQIAVRQAQDVAGAFAGINPLDPSSVFTAIEQIRTASERTAAEQAALEAAYDSLRDEQLRYAKLVARNATLQNASALDNIAAIAATVNALRAELDLLRQRDTDEQEILAKEIELRDAIAQQRLAEADRRAAFFRLTAGTGDEIRAAQADLRAAIDRLETIENQGGADTQAGYEAELAVLRARERLAQLSLRLADQRRRVASDITDTYEQALLDVQAAQEAARQATGDLEKIEAEISVREAESRAQREFFDQRLSDLGFLFQTDQIGRSRYIAGLRAFQQGIDRTTRQGEELWREIELQIRGLQEDASNAFNIPTEIRLPTLFEVRRALAADALGVNYQDNRTQEINVFVSDDVDVNAVIAAIEASFGGTIDLEAQRLASGGAGITIGGF